MGDLSEAGAGGAGADSGGEGPSSTDGGEGASPTADAAGAPGSPWPGAVDASTGLSALMALSACSGTVSDIFSKSAIQPPATGSGVYNPADPTKRAALDASIRALVGGDVSSALSSAQAASYEMCRTDDSGSLVVIWKPQVTGQGHALAAWRTQGAKPLIVEAPHAFHDVSTELESTQMFLQLKARALVMSGIYRCSSLSAGPCDGYTTACTGIDIPYTISDAAHNSEMFFQAAHVALADSFANDYVTSVHGMPDTGISVSNGTKMSPAADSFQVRLLNALTAALPGEQITSCQAYRGIAATSRWCGSENVQGRYVNHASDVCAANATATSNRFVHVEQSLTIRQQSSAQVIAAFGNALQ